MTIPRGRNGLIRRSSSTHDIIMRNPHQTEADQNFMSDFPWRSTRGDITPYPRNFSPRGQKQHKLEISFVGQEGLVEARDHNEKASTLPSEPQSQLILPLATPSRYFWPTFPNNTLNWPFLTPNRGQNDIGDRQGKNHGHRNDRRVKVHLRAKYHLA